MITACAPAPRPTDFHDPNETQNRRIHAFNKEMDRKILKPMSSGLAGSGNGPVSKGIGNFAANLALPGMILNDALQLNLVDMASNSVRLVMNSTVGLGGLLDVAGQNGIPEKSTDFGETLHVWGFSEGNYVELPFLGPSTQRDAVGLMVDLLVDPVNQVIPRRYLWAVPAAKVLKKVNDRGRYGSLVDSIYYGSDDSYAQARLLYLQSRRQQLYGELNEDDLEDPYADF